LLAAAHVAPGVAAQEEELVSNVAPEVLKFFAEFDTNGDGKLEREEFLVVAAQEADEVEGGDKDRVQWRYQRLFDSADMDGDGLINERELEYMHTLGIQAMWYELDAEAAGREVSTSVDAAEMFGTKGFQDQLDATDENGNGVIEKEEFLNAMKQTARDSWGIGRYLDDERFLKWLDSLFVHADVDGDGVMGVKEVQYTAFLAERAWQAGALANLAVASLVLDVLDRDGDGRLNAEEIEEAFAKAQAKAERSGEGEALEAEGAGGDAEEATDAPGAEDGAADEGEKEEDEDEGEEEDIRAGLSLVGRIHARWRDFDGDGDHHLDKEEVAKLSTVFAMGEL